MIKEQTEKTKPYIDYLIDRLVSRKFIAACVATWLVWYEKISGTEWTIFMALYISTLVFLKLLPFLSKRLERRLGHFMNQRRNDDAIDTDKIPEID